MNRFIKLIAGLIFETIFIFCLARTASAQVSIGKFYSQGTYKNKPLDWVEIVNNSGSQINLRNYQIKDSSLSSTNTFGFESDTYLDAGRSCIKEVGQMLNKDKDIIYIFDGDNQIFCLEYGSSDTNCNHTTEIGSDPNMPAPECTSLATPAPTPPPTKAPATSPTISATKTPIPTLKVTPSPASKPETTQVTLAPSSTPTPEVLSEATQNPTPTSVSQNKTEEENPQQSSKKNYFAPLAIAVGIIIFGFGIYLLLIKLKKKYNDGYGSLQKD